MLSKIAFVVVCVVLFVAFSLADVWVARAFGLHPAIARTIVAATFAMLFVGLLGVISASSNRQA